MTTIATKLRPGLLVALKTSVRGGVQYVHTDIENDGVRYVRYETERTIFDPTEHERAIKTRARVRSLIRSVCVSSAFGFLCLDEKRPQLDEAVKNARMLADAFNATSKLSRVEFNVMIGQVAATDLEAIRSFNSEVRDLMAGMTAGIGAKDVKAIRDAADNAARLARMMQAETQAVVDEAVAAARKAASEVGKAQKEKRAVNIDLAAEAIIAITNQRTMFLDYAEGDGVQAPVETKAGTVTLDLEAL